MKFKVLHLKTILLWAVLIAAAVKSSAQELTTETALGLIKRNATAIGLSGTDLQNLRISKAYVDKISGAALVYAQQTYKGVDVFNAVQTYAFKNDKLVSAFGGRLKMEEMVNSKNAKPGITAANAVAFAAAHLQIASPSALVPLKKISEGEFDFGDAGISTVDIRSRLIWLPDEMTNKASLSWQVQLQPLLSSDMWLVNVDALKGSVISKINLTVYCSWSAPAVTGNAESLSMLSAPLDEPEGIEAVNSAKYKVVPFPAESPSHPGGTPALKTNPWTLAGTGNAATTLKWNDDGTSYDSTRGNNVLAQEDANGNNGFGAGARSTTALPDLTFNSSPNFSAAPTTAANRRFAIINLFYWNNIMHDIAYQYGFDEVSGNFQKNNLGRGGAGNDFVMADAQDGSGTNNANFATPSDGSNPRMQMFLFSAAANANIIKPAAIAGRKSCTESAFSTNNKLASKGPLQKPVVLFADNAGNTTHLGCNAATNPGALNGKIALIDRGDCNFTTKVKNAQLAGAAGAIVVDNIPGEYPIIMGGTDNTITIPAVMISYEDGNSIKHYLALDSIVTIKLSAGVALDGDLDNGVISHEYTHGISNRLTGGPNNVSCLNNKEQMGEGWSDYMALMVTTNWSITTLADSSKSRPIGTYVLGQGPDGPGIRYYPYSTDLSVNPWTYDSMKLSSRFTNGTILKPSDPHIVGEVWCNMLWNMTWGIIKQTGAAKPNIYNAAGIGGNQIALQLVIEGMKLQPCSPGFVDGRNAILKADTMLYGGIHVDAIWRAFASKGLGYNASQGSSNNVKDGVADYSLPPNTFAKASQIQQAVSHGNGMISLSPNPATDRITLNVNGNKQLLKVDLIATTGQRIQTFEMRGEDLNAKLPKLASGLYYLKITGDNFSETRKLIIQ